MTNKFYSSEVFVFLYIIHHTTILLSYVINFLICLIGPKYRFIDCCKKWIVILGVDPNHIFWEISHVINICFHLVRDELYALIYHVFDWSFNLITYFTNYTD